MPLNTRGFFLLGELAYSLQRMGNSLHPGARGCWLQKGVIGVAEHTETCPVCGGAGADTESRYCLRCHGSGVVSLKEPAVAKET